MLRGQPAWLSISAEITPIGWRIPMAAASQSLFVVGEMCLDTCSDQKTLCRRNGSTRWKTLLTSLLTSLFCVANVTISHCILIAHFPLYRNFCFNHTRRDGEFSAFIILYSGRMWKCKGSQPGLPSSLSHLFFLPYPYRVLPCFSHLHHSVSRVQLTASQLSRRYISFLLMMDDLTMQAHHGCPPVCLFQAFLGSECTAQAAEKGSHETVPCLAVSSLAGSIATRCHALLCIISAEPLGL